MGKRAVLALAWATAVVVWAAAASAAGEPGSPAGESAPADGQAPAPARELLLFEEPVVEAAGKHVQTAREAASSVTVISREDIRRFGWRTLAEALRSVPGLYTTNDRNYTYLGVRGFQRPGDYNDRILLLVNGHSYNDDVYQTAFLGNEFGIDLEAIDRIEVIRGPGSALYGGNALFAVVNVVTLTARDDPGVHALVETGSYVRKRSQIRAGHVFENGLDVYAVGSILDVDGQSTLSYPALASRGNPTGSVYDLDGERAYDFFTIAHWKGFRFQAAANRREKDIPTAPYDTEVGAPGTFTTDQRQFAEVAYSVAPRADVTVDARAYWDRTRYQGTWVYGSGAQRTKNQDDTHSDWMGTEVRGSWAPSPAHLLVVGAEGTWHPDAFQTNYDRFGVTYLSDRREFNSWGVYSQYEWSPWRPLTLVGGLRFDRVYDRIEEVSPRAAVIWTPRDSTTVKLLYGSAFRPPNLYEQYYGTSSEGDLYLPNPGLEPERIRTYEAVLEQALPWRVRGKLSLWQYDLDELVDQERFQRNGRTAFQFQNAGSATARGIETDLRVPLPLGSTLQASWCLQTARDDDGHLLSNSPKNLARVGLLFPLPFGVQGGTELLVTGPRHALDGRRLETATTANLFLRAPTPIDGLSFSGGVYNMFNHTYPDPGGTENRQDRIPQDGITFRLQVEYAF